MGFHYGSADKESACNAGDLGSVPGWGRSLGEGNDYPLQYSCLENPWTEEPGGLQSMGSQTVGHDLTFTFTTVVQGFPGASVRNPPAMQETQVRSLGGEDPLAKEMAPHSSILAWKISWTEEPGGLQSMGSQRVGQH